MKILGLCGSPRGCKSQTRVLLEAALATARAQGAETEVVDLAQVRIGFCQACDACHTGPDCVLNDEARPILRAMLAADGIILATPVYLDHVTSQMKALLDRTSHFIHCLSLGGKYLAAVATSGGGGNAATVAFLQRYATSVGAWFAGSVEARVPLKESDLERSREMGADLVKAITDHRTWPEQEAALAAQRARFALLIAAHERTWPYEFKYWQELGWI